MSVAAMASMMMSMGKVWASDAVPCAVTAAVEGSALEARLECSCTE